MRARAELALQALSVDAKDPLEPMSAQAMQRLLHELRVHQIELEMQNDELRQAQLAADESRARYFDLYDLAPVGYCTVNQAGMIVQTNLTLATLTGLARGALVKRQFRHFILKADQDHYHLLRRRLTETGDTQSCELRMLRIDGSQFWAQLVASAAMDDDGAPALRLTVSDVSERKRSEELQLWNQSLLHSNTFGRAILDSVSASVAVLNREGVITEVNEPWRRFALENARQPGQPAPNTDIGTNYLAVYGAGMGVPPDQSVASVITGIRSVLDGSLPSFSVEYPCDTASRKLWFSMFVTPLGADRQGVVVAHTDITEHKRAEAALHQSELRWKFAIDGSGDGLWDWNVADDTVFYSHRWKEMLGYADDEIGTSPEEWAQRLHPQDKAAALDAMQACLDRKTQIYTREHRIRGKDGRYLWILSRGVVINRGSDGKPLRMIGTHSDVSSRKRSEAALIGAQSLALKANQAKSRFLAAASHDLRQPLSALALYVDVLKSKVTPEIGPLVGNIQKCCDSLTELLTDLLDVSKLEAGVVKSKPTDFAVHDFLAALVSVHQAEAAVKGLTLRWRSCHGFIHTDQRLLLRIVSNLVANAVRYTDQGGVLIACRQHGGKNWLEVWDTGVGIPAEKMEVIFEEFSQLGPEAENRGSGLGLAIVAKAAALLGLQIRLRSRPGRGSVFAVELPAGRATHPSAVPVPASVARHLRIALVDDNAQVLDALAVALRAAGHEVIAAATGDDLLKRLDQQGPDIVISDYRLGAGETGFDVVKAMRAAFGEALPALIVTGDTDSGLVRSMADRGITIQYKPLKMDTLQAFINQATERREP